MMQRSYTIKGETITLDVDESVIAVKFDRDTPRSKRASSIRSLTTYRRTFEIPGEDIVLVPVPRRIRRTGGADAISRTLSEQPTVDRFMRVFKKGDKKLVAAPRLHIGLTEGAEAVDELIAAHDLEVLESFGDAEYLVGIPGTVDPLDLVDGLNDDKRIDYAEPDFVIIGSHRPRRPGAVNAPHIRTAPARPRAPSDPRLAEQYAVFITKSDAAWGITRGDPKVKIAILDEGVDISHPDLHDAIVGMYDATDNDEWQEPMSWDAHGTACAGLAAGIPENDEGICGIGGGCSILAVRIAYSTHPKASWVTKNRWIRRAIDWSWKNGADILSNSWGGGAESWVIKRAFKRARTRGRGGRGCVIVVAAGNEAGPVPFPGNLPNVLTVSASNEYDEFKTQTSQDGEYWWGSCFGPEVDVAAPGVHNLTTDISGAGGYTPSDYSDFNGTSSATPIVAGACGLLLSVDNELDEVDVRRAIRSGADKVGEHPYTDDRNDQMGYGRLNVLRALEHVL